MHGDGVPLASELGGGAATSSIGGGVPVGAGVAPVPRRWRRRSSLGQWEGLQCMMCRVREFRGDEHVAIARQHALVDEALSRW